MIKGYSPQPNDWGAVFNLDCQKANAVVKWYDNPDYEIDDPQACAPGLEYIPTEWQQTECAGRPVPTGDAIKFSDLEGNETEDISYIERLTVTRVNKCKSGCGGRRPEFRQAVIKMFLERCYTIADCKVDPNDNVVLNEDVDRIVDQMVAQCQGQCALSTYTCMDSECRLPNTPKTEYGHNFGETNLKIGVGGHVDANGLAIANDCIKVIGERMTNCTSHVEDNLSFSEYTKVLQATSWFVELDVATKCNADGEYVEGDPVTHYYKEGKLIPHVTANCDGNPTKDTFVEKEAYEKEKIGFEIGSGTEGDKVASPKVKITVDVVE
jgi:hypothetical protein